MVDYYALSEIDVKLIRFMNDDERIAFMEHFGVSEFSEIRDIFCDCVETAIDTENGYPCRKAHLFTAITLYNAFSELQKEFVYNESACFYADKFERRDLASAPLSRFEDGINYDAPEEEGLYLIGEVNANPYTLELFYWVKTGYSKNIAERLKKYDTHCPMLWRADFKTDCCNARADEKYYQKLLNRIGVAKCNHNEEWFLVSRETYLAICEKGFSYFD